MTAERYEAASKSAEIADLDVALQAAAMPGEWRRWGSISRKAWVGPGVGYHFYCDDYKFTMLCRRPWMLPATGCAVAVEPNFSTWSGMDRLEAAAAIAWKRRLARSWQRAGVRIVVDLNLHADWWHLAFLGVPPGWRAYATRRHRGIDVSAIEAVWRAASDHAGTEDILFAVFGGWRKIRDACRERGWTWVGEDLHRALGSTDGTRKWK